MGGARGVACFRESFDAALADVEDLGEAEVEDLDRVAEEVAPTLVVGFGDSEPHGEGAAGLGFCDEVVWGGDEDIVGLEVAVEDALLVCGREGGEELRCEVHSLAGGEWAACLEEAGEWESTDEFEGEEGGCDPALFIEMAGGDEAGDAGVAQFAGNIGLALEAEQILVLAFDLFVEGLEGDEASIAEVVCCVDHAEGSCADDGADAEASVDGGVWQEGVGHGRGARGRD